MYVHVHCRNLSSFVEHKGISVRTGKMLLNPFISSKHHHALQAGHDINTNCFKIIHKLEHNFINISEIILIKKFSPDLSNQVASTNLNILSWVKFLVIYESTRKLYIIFLYYLYRTYSI